MKIDRQLIEELQRDGGEVLGYLPRIKGMPQRAAGTLGNRIPRHPAKTKTEIHEQIDTLHDYDFTYNASRHEEWWLLDSLGPFFEEQWFDDVLQIIKGGKEASVYLCRANPSTDVNLLAAKVYRPRSLRNLRKDHIYREGRSRLDADGLEIVDERQNRAIQHRTTYGQELMHTSWIEHEFRTMQILHQAGCDIPKPYASDHNAILMDYIGDDLMAAPTLNGVRLAEKEGQVLFERIIFNLDLMLSHQRVHGDLSAYNILYWDGKITLIDFPQAINPIRNPNAFFIFQGDVTRICEYFIAHQIKIDPTELAVDLWTSHGYSTAPNILWEEDQEEYLD